MDTSLNVSGASSGGGYRRGQSCTPLMIAHLLRHGEDMQIWGEPVRLVTFVAILRKVDNLSTKVTFIFEDETAAIKGVKWLDGQHTGFVCPVRIGSYARVYGYMRRQNNENFILVLNIQPIEHVNELLSHLMEVTLVSLEGGKEAEQVEKSENTFVNHSANTTAEDIRSYMTTDQALVYEIIKNGNPDYGAKRCEIKSKLPPNYSSSRLDEILNFLADEGHVYTTKTDDFFKAV